MRVHRLLCLLGITIFGPGCILVRDGTGLLCFKVKESMQEALEHHRNRRWADDAWDRVYETESHGSFSGDYAHGFKEGFVQYLYEGGTGEPPLVPPKHYRGLRFQTGQGYQAVQDWFAGYRHGAETAKQSGYRQWITGSSSLPPPEWPPPPVPAHPTSPMEMRPGPETLPLPRMLKPGAEALAPAHPTSPMEMRPGPETLPLPRMLAPAAEAPAPQARSEAVLQPSPGPPPEQEKPAAPWRLTIRSLIPGWDYEMQVEPASWLWKKK